MPPHPVHVHALGKCVPMYVMVHVASEMDVCLNTYLIARHAACSAWLDGLHHLLEYDLHLLCWLHTAYCILHGTQ